MTLTRQFVNAFRLLDKVIDQFVALLDRFSATSGRFMDIGRIDVNFLGIVGGIILFE